MRFRRGVRLFGSAALSLFLLSGASACSSQQQDEEGLEIDQEGGDDEFAEENGQEEGEFNNEEMSEGDQFANQYDEGGEEGGEFQQGFEGQENTADASFNGNNATESDLQEIMQEMNGQQVAGGDLGGEMGAEPLAPTLEPEAPMSAPAPAPMNAATAAAPAAPMPAAGAMALPFQPGGSPAAPGLPEMNSKMAYIVQHGDTLGKISAKIYGNSNRWRELASLSGITNPSRIYPGDLVYYTLDESALAFATAYEQVPRQEEIVQPGDTLASIAHRVYGDSQAWRAIWRQNDTIDNPDRIPPGATVFYLQRGALSAELKKVRAQMAQLAAITKTEQVVVQVSDVQKTSNQASANNFEDAASIDSTGFKLAGGQSMQLGYSIENVLNPAASVAIN